MSGRTPSLKSGWLRKKVPDETSWFWKRGCSNFYYWNCSEERGRFQIGIGEFDRVLEEDCFWIGWSWRGWSRDWQIHPSPSGDAPFSIKGEKGPFYISEKSHSSRPKDEADRIRSFSDHLFVVSETSLEKIFQDIQTLRPTTGGGRFHQTIYSSELPSTPGSISQVKRRRAGCSIWRNISPFHLSYRSCNQEGFIAGPKVLEHMVDTVLYIKEKPLTPSASWGQLKIVLVHQWDWRFEMKDSGLVEVVSPSEFLPFRKDPTRLWFCGHAQHRRFRPILIELQALVVPTSLVFPGEQPRGSMPTVYPFSLPSWRKTGTPPWQSRYFSQHRRRNEGGGACSGFRNDRCHRLKF